MLEIILLVSLLTIAIITYFSDEKYTKTVLVAAGSMVGLFAVYNGVIRHDFIVMILFGIASAFAMISSHRNKLFGLSIKKLVYGYLISLGFVFWLFGAFLYNVSSPPYFHFYEKILSPLGFFQPTLGITTVLVVILSLIIALFHIRKHRGIKPFLNSFILSLWIILLIGQLFHYSFFSNFTVHRLRISDNFYFGFGADAKNKSGKTKIYEAIRTGDLEEVKELVQKGANVNSEYDLFGIKESPIAYSIKYNQYEIFRFLIDHGADYKKLNNKMSLLQIAAKAQNTDLRFTQDLLNLGLDISHSDSNSYQAIYLASKGYYDMKNDVFVSKVNIIDFLVKHGANVNSQGPYGEFETPLYAAVMNSNFEGMKRLIELGANPNVPGLKYRDPRMMLNFHDSLLLLALEIRKDPFLSNNSYSLSRKDRIQKIIEYLEYINK